MAVFYVRSTDGSDSDDGSTWALAKATIAGAIAAASAGDTIYVSHQHAESQASAMTLSFPGTVSSPNLLLCVNDGAEPPTTLATSATVTTTGASNLDINGCLYSYGIAFSAASGNVAARLGFGTDSAATHQRHRDCTFIHGSTATSSQNMQIGSTGTAGSRGIFWHNCDVSFTGTGNRIALTSGSLYWRGGGFASGTATPTNGVFYPNGTSFAGGEFELSGVDLSELSSSMNLFTISKSSVTASLRNCKLPASWSGGLVSDSWPALFGSFEMHNCDSADTNYRLWIESYAGSTKSETTLVRTGGASDGTTGISWKMETSANASYPVVLLFSPEIARWNETTASSITVAVDVLHDSATNLTDADIWLEVQYLGTSGYPLGAFASDEKSDVLASAADQTTSAATWTTTGMSNPNTQKLSVTFTPQEKGFIQARVVLASASKTVYVDPLLQVS